MITSVTNAKVKEVIKLQKSARLRREKELYIVEGIRMFEEAPERELVSVWVSESFAKKHAQLLRQKTGFTIENKTAVLDKAERERAGTGASVELVTDEIFAHISDTKTPQGVLCVLRQRRYSLEELLQAEAPLWVVLDGLQDPGNLGTILRTAEAAGVTGIILSRDCADIYNPKVIRSTMGSIYRLPFVSVEDLPKCLEQMRKQGITLYAAYLEGSNLYDKESYLGGTAFLIGNEGNGLKEETLHHADRLIRIPMEGKVESLNAAVAASLLMFEARRQRRDGG
jgi:RNA methyltransferase, TrmH family